MQLKLEFFESEIKNVNDRNKQLIEERDELKGKQLELK